MCYTFFSALAAAFVAVVAVVVAVAPVTVTKLCRDNRSIDTVDVHGF